jgi:3'-phosphoadenosine 5'-phosphosulfate sulfotransferase (PAPS reductase)/FAD synthetase
MKFKSAYAVIDSAFDAGAEVMVPLFSGGHDSLSAVYIASKHPKFDGSVYHIDTGIGAAATRRFVEQIAVDYGWTLRVFKSPSTYEMFIREKGFPGPGMHRWAYIRLKERCIRQILRTHGKQKVALITGCRSQESTRRMGHVEPLKIGESTKRGIVNKRRYWVAPCHDWSTEDQHRFMETEDLPLNPLKLSPIRMSGECFCGAFARPAEIELIRKYAPDVAAEIDRLTVIAAEQKVHCVWGTRPDRRKGTVVAKTGPLCNSCDARALSAGIILDSRE